MQTLIVSYVPATVYLKNQSENTLFLITIKNINALQ